MHNIEAKNYLNQIQRNAPKELGPLTCSPDGHIIYQKTGKVQDMSTDSGYDNQWQDPDQPLVLHIKRVEQPKDFSGIYYISWFGHSVCSRQLRLSVNYSQGGYFYEGPITQRSEPRGYYIVAPLGSFTLDARKKWEKAAQLASISMNTAKGSPKTSLSWVIEVMEKAIEMKVFTREEMSRCLLAMEHDRVWRGRP